MCTCSLRQGLESYAASSYGDATFTQWALLMLRTAEPEPIRLAAWASLEDIAARLAIRAPGTGAALLTLTLTLTLTVTLTLTLTLTLTPTLTLTLTFSPSRTRTSAARSSRNPRCVPSSRLTRRPPSPAVAPHGRSCHSHGPGRFPSS